MIKRLSWLAVLVVIISGGLMGVLSGGDSASQSPVAVPSDAESARADALRADFPGGDQAPAILVVTRATAPNSVPTTSMRPPRRATG